MTRQERRIQIANLRVQLQEAEQAERKAFLQGDVLRYQQLTAEIYNLQVRISRLQQEPITE